jgi:hypothetical protein
LSFEIPGDDREHSLLLDQAGAYQWDIKAISKEKGTRALKQSGRFELLAVKKNWFSIDLIEPQERVLRSYGLNTSLNLRWRLGNERGEDVSAPSGDTKFKQEQYRLSKRGRSEKILYEVEVSSKKSGERRKFSVETQELIIPRVEPGELNIRIQAFSGAGIEISQPLEFAVEVLESEAPRWPAGTENNLIVREIRPGTFEANWNEPSSPVQYYVTLKRDGQLVKSFETSEKKHVFKRLLPGRYRFEIIARGLKREFELSPLTETWTVLSESAVPAPKLKKIEVRQ